MLCLFQLCVLDLALASWFLIVLLCITLQATGRSGSRGGSGGGGEDVDLRLLVHQSQAGCIIGKSGFKIKELREVSVVMYYL
jgi:hypothetical protein